MSLILNIDTSSSVCSVCLAENGDVIEERNEVSENKHASQLTILIREIVENQKMKLRDLSAVAISSGPGSYTGLRIGTSVAKGISYGIEKPLIAVSTLQGMAHKMSTMNPDPNGIYIPMIDARRSNVYMAVYDSDNNVMENDRFANINVDLTDNFGSYNVKSTYLGGLDAPKLQLICLNNYNCTLLENIICVASNISTISYKRFVHNVFENLTYFEPFYLKEFEGRMKIG